MTELHWMTNSSLVKNLIKTFNQRIKPWWKHLCRTSSGKIFICSNFLLTILRNIFVTINKNFWMPEGTPPSFFEGEDILGLLKKCQFCASLTLKISAAWAVYMAVSFPLFVLPFTLRNDICRSQVDVVTVH